MLSRPDVVRLGHSVGILAMSCTISISDRRKDVWMIQNSIYAWFVDLALERSEHDEAVSYHLEMSEYTNGVSLDKLFEEDAEVAQRVLERILIMAREVAAGRHELVDEEGERRIDMQEQCNKAFADLVELLAPLSVV